MKILLLIFSLFAVQLHAALSSGIVWEVRTGGNANNGGGYKTGASGTDWTLQNSPQYALTGIATAGLGATFLTASAAADMVGNVVHVVSGTNFTPGFYEITSVSAGVSVTCDANITTGVGASGVLNIGGALAAIGTIGSATANQGAVAGNLICVKSGSYTIGASDTFGFSGTNTLPIRIAGYSSTRPTITTQGDGYQGRTAGAGLITTNMPAYTYSSTFRMIVNGQFIAIQTLNIGSEVNNAAVDFSNTADCYMTQSVMVNSSATSGAITLASGVRTLFDDLDIALTGATSGSQVVYASFGRMINCRIWAVSTTPMLVNLPDSNATLSMTRNVLYGGSVGVSVSSTTAIFSIDQTTITAVSGDGINVVAGNTRLNSVTNCMMTDNTGWAVNLNNANVSCILGNNRYRDNTSGNVNLGTGWATATNHGAVTTDTGGATTDYVAPVTFDYRLIAASPATSAAQPASASMGALQRTQTGGGGGQTSSASAQ